MRAISSKSHNPAILLPDFYGQQFDYRLGVLQEPAYQPGALQRLAIAVTPELDAILDMAVSAHEIGPVALHVRTSRNGTRATERLWPNEVPAADKKFHVVGGFKPSEEIHS
jgi:hypothetical protein